MMRRALWLVLLAAALAGCSSAASTTSNSTATIDPFAPTTISLASQLETTFNAANDATAALFHSTGTTDPTPAIVAYQALQLLLENSAWPPGAVADARTLATAVASLIAILPAYPYDTQMSADYQAVGVDIGFLAHDMGLVMAPPSTTG